MRTTKFNVEEFRKVLEQTEKNPRIVQNMVETTIKNLGFKDMEEYDSAFANYMWQKARTEVDGFTEASLKELDFECEKVSRKIDKKYQVDFLRRVEAYKINNYTTEQAKTKAEFDLHQLHGLSLYGGNEGQLKRQLDLLKEQYEYNEEELQSIEIIAKTYGLNIPQAVQKLIETNIAEQIEKEDSINNELEEGEEIGDIGEYDGAGEFEGAGETDTQD